MNEVRHGWMSSELGACDEDEREIRLAELCGCGWLEFVALKGTASARETERTQGIILNHCFNNLIGPSGPSPSTRPAVRFEGRATTNAAVRDIAPAQAALDASETGAPPKACSIMACAISRSPMMVVSAPCFCR
jgi:hypothetical protein